MRGYYMALPAWLLSSDGVTNLFTSPPPSLAYEHSATRKVLISEKWFKNPQGVIQLNNESISMEENSSHSPYRRILESSRTTRILKTF